MELKVGDRVEFVEKYMKTEKGAGGVVVRVATGMPEIYGQRQLVSVRLDNGTTTSAFERRLRLSVKPKVGGVFKRIAQVSFSKGPLRDLSKVMLQLTEEVGELATEVAIHEGSKIREAGKDGVVGEAVDVALVALDIALLANGGNVQEVKQTLLNKIEKWESYK